MVSTPLLLLLLAAAGSLALSTTAGDEPFNEEEEDVFNDIDDLTDINFGEDNPDFDNDRTLTNAQDRIGFNELANFQDSEYNLKSVYRFDPWHWRWIGGIIPYKFSSNISPKIQSAVRTTMNYLMKNTCLKFAPINKFPKEYQPIKNFLTFDRSKSQCFSHYGKMSGAPVYGAVLNLGSRDCQYAGKTLMHELLHSLGFLHTMRRPDRDDNIIMHWENLSDEKRRLSFQTLAEESNYGKGHHVKEYGVTHGLPYECHSIMHYKPNQYAKSGTVMFEAKDKKKCNFYSGDFAHPKYKMTANDMAAVNLVYCPKDRKQINWKGEKQWSYENWWNPKAGKTCKSKPKDKSSYCTEMRSGCVKSNWYREMQYYCPGYCMKMVKEMVCNDPDNSYGLSKKMVRKHCQETC